jgi:hypothetical protein
VAQFFDPIVLLQVLKKLETTPNNQIEINAAFQGITEYPDPYYSFLQVNELIALEKESISITYKGLALLRKAEVLVLSADKSVANL